METKAPITIPQQAFDWYDDYVHGGIDRRTFLTRLGSLAIAGLSIGAITEALLPNYALAEQVSFNDETIKATYTEFDSPQGFGKGRGYLVVPRNLSSKASMILVVHENRGLNPYIEDVARRLAKQGYVAFAPDALYSLGGYPGNDDQGRDMQKSLDPAKIEQDFIAAAQFLKNHELSQGKVGVVGFCFGGYISNMLATMPELIHAAVPFYGTPAKANLDKVKGPLLIHFAETDERVNATWAEYEKTLKGNNANYQAHTYSATQHGFHNDSTARYHPASAELAWSRTLEFFKQYLTATG